MLPMQAGACRLVDGRIQPRLQRVWQQRSAPVVLAAGAASPCSAGATPGPVGPSLW